MGRKKMSQGNDARQVAPSRRRSGLVRRASELTTLCAVETALVLFYQDGRRVEPNMAPTGNPNSGLCHRTLAEHEAAVQALEKEYRDLLEKVEAEKKRGEELTKRMMESQQSHPCRWWDAPVEDLTGEELQKRMSFVEAFQANIEKHLQERLAQSPVEGSSDDRNGHGIGIGTGTGAGPAGN